MWELGWVMVEIRERSRVFFSTTLIIVLLFHMNGKESFALPSSASVVLPADVEIPDFSFLG